MKRFLLKTAGYLILIISIANLFSFSSLYFLRKSNFYKPLFVNNYTQKHFDYVVLGSSTGLTTLNAFVIDSMTGMSGLNASMDDTSMGSQYVMLQQILKSGKKIDNCVLTISYVDAGNTTPTLSGNDYRFLPLVKENHIQEYYRGFDTIQARILSLSEWLPVIGVAYYNTEIFYPSLVTLINPKRRNRFDTKGNYVYPDQKKVKQRAAEGEKITFRNPFFYKIEELCRKNNIELIVYHPPVYKIKVIGEVSGHQFINHSNLFSDSIYFYDNIHVNRRGRNLATQAFANEL